MGSATIIKYYNVDASQKKTKNIYAGDELVGTVETVTIISRLNKIKPLPKSDSTSTKLSGSQNQQNLVRPPICLACNGGTPILVTTPYYNHVDHLNSVNVVTDQNGGQVELLDYYPYGASRISTGDRTSQRQYIGQIYDTDTGLNYLNARYYKGSIGQFISEDPMFWSFDENWLMDPQNQNSYSYARDNPINRSDPTGRESKKINLNTIKSFISSASSYLGSLFAKQQAQPSSAKAGVQDTSKIAPTTASNVSQQGIDFIKRQEGFVSGVYSDPVQINTIGYGHVVLPGEDFSNGISKQQANQILMTDIQKANDKMSKNITASLAQNQFDALTSFTFNVGLSPKSTSSIINAVNNGTSDSDAIKKTFGLYIYGGGKILQGLVSRRAEEAELYSNGKY